MEEEDEEEWTLEGIRSGSGEDWHECKPNPRTTSRLVKEYHDMWIMARVGTSDQTLRATNVADWLTERFQVDPDVMDFDVFYIQVEIEHSLIAALRGFVLAHDLINPELGMLKECSRVFYNVYSLFVNLSRLIRNCDPQKVGDFDGDRIFPQDLRGAAGVERQNEQSRNCFDYDSSANTNFQNLFIYLTEVLQAKAYRRASGKFFKQITTRTGFRTNAFQESSTVADFVNRHCSHCLDFKVWQWATNPPGNFENVIKYMKDRSLPEAPDLVEDCHLRSYEGDSVGRGAGIYDCESDMFFPYVLRSDWKELADLAQRVRGLTNPKYQCTPPKDGIVCVVHLDCAFPYDIYGELRELATLETGSCWRNAEGYECAKDHELENAELAAHLARRLPPSHSKEEVLPTVVGETWQLVPDGISFPPDNEDWHELSTCEIHTVLQEYMGCGNIPVPSEVQKKCLGPHVDSSTFVSLDQGNAVYVPLETPRSRRRATLTSEEMASFGVESSDLKPRSHLRCEHDGVERFFRLHSGRTWLECDTEEIDHIYVCQKFTTHDRFMLYGCKGRLFFEVGEFDTYELTLFLEGIGGCGKTTIMKAEQAFWPPHLRGILSPNMQPQFGMSAVCKAKAVFCNEVSADLNIVQEEWQTACSGEWGSYAVKFEEPVTMKWVAHMFWIGNGFPTKFKNLQGQVSRRLAGVLMAHPVAPRDGSIINKIFKKLGALQRKQVLAYFDLVQVNGTTDPMSMPDKLPPAFAEYYRKSRRATDPIEDFLSEGSFVKVSPEKKMLMSDFKELYGQYRIKYDLGKALRWSEATYRTPFNERGLFVRREDSIKIMGVEHRDVDVIVGLGIIE